MMTNRSFLLFALAVLITAGGAELSSQVFAPGPGHRAINYYGPADDAVAGLAARIASGNAALDSGRIGYLESVLDALAVPVDSQVAVFAKNSLQKPYIHPANPRLIYFNDSVMVAAIRGAPLIEIAAVDGDKGIVFYTVEQGARNPAPVRQNDACLLCHDSLNSQGIPGLLLRSVPPSLDGTPNPHLGNSLTSHRSPFAERWAGWYVTGEHGFAHMGNGVVTDIRDAGSLTRNQRLVLEGLDGEVPPAATLVPTSDVIALMVLDHQVDMTNLLIRYGWEVRYAAAEGETGAVDLDTALDEVVDYMFFTGEAPMDVPITGASSFRREFESRGPEDSEGRSLRQFNLETRLMRYPLSYMIYSEAFTELPSEARAAIYERIRKVLAADPAPRYAHLSAADRLAITEILRETKDDLPESFRRLGP